ncbi:Cytochrome P450 83B1 [Linum perenne]
MSYLLIYLLLTFPIIIYLFLNKHKKTPYHDSLPPGPKGLPFLGNLFQIDASAPHRCLMQLSQVYGPLMIMKQGCIRILVVSSAKMAQEVMKTHDLIFSNRQSVLGQQKLSYNGLDLAFAPYGSYWREMRKVCVVHLFNSNRVQSFGPIREFEVSKMLEKISKSSTPFNLSNAMTSLTSTIICRVAFGKRYEEEGIERSRFQSLLKETQVMFTSFYFSDHFPFLSFIDRLSGLINRLDKNFKEFDAFYQEVIDEHLDPKRDKPEQEDILDVLLQIWKYMQNVFIGGTDTSAAAVVWAMTYLMKNPLTMEKAQKEVRNAIGKKGFVNEEDIQQLSYLKAVVKETMRLQPAVPFLIPRESTQSCNLGGYVIPAKKRFLGKSTDVKGLDFELIPFGAGRRICPGIHMGLSTVELSLANLLYAFDWEMPTGVKSEDLDMDISPGLAMHKKNALCLMAKNYI